ncbi:MAG: hypothetical protein IJ180_02605 [Bacteroidales bacterium]|nr:hypothetical protein [Bacteroidales bacterium]
MKHLVKILFLSIIFTVCYKNVSASLPDTVHYYKPYFVDECMENLSNNLHFELLHVGRWTHYHELAQPYVLPDEESIRIKGVGFLGYIYYNTY